MGGFQFGNLEWGVEPGKVLETVRFPWRKLGTDGFPRATEERVRFPLGLPKENSSTYAEEFSFNGSGESNRERVKTACPPMAEEFSLSEESIRKPDRVRRSLSGGGRFS